jgi:hypothetical protein
MSTLKQCCPDAAAYLALGRENDTALAPTAPLWLYDILKNSGKFGPFCDKKLWTNLSV